MRDHLEKYLELNRQFPNMAGKLHSMMVTQRRQIGKLHILARTNQDVEALILTCAETYDVALDLLGWMKEVIQEVAIDSEAMREGAKVRNALDWQNAIVEEYLKRYDNEIEKAMDKLNQRPI